MIGLSEEDKSGSTSFLFTRSKEIRRPGFDSRHYQKKK
jgi:hypothetical protein